MEGVYVVAPKENLSKHKSMVKAQCTNHRNTLTPLVWQLHLHSSFNPHSGRLHPEVERRLVDLDNICGWFSHYSSSNPLRELLLLVHEFHLPFGFGPIHYLRFPIGGPMLYVDLPNQPCR